jgi:membrane protease YdiL (CAAX protease family)
MTLPRKLVLALLAPLTYLLAAALLAALLAYPLFLLSGSDDISTFRTLVSRGGQCILLLGLVPLGRRFGINTQTLGFSRGFIRQWLAGFAAGFMMLGLHVAALVGLGIREVTWSKWTPGQIGPILGKALLIGLAIGLLEETLFRGALLAAVRRLSGPVLAVIVSALFYAALHFIGTQWSTDLDRIGWDTGIRIALDGFSHLREAAPDNFLGLFMAGLFLGTLRVLRPDALAVCMGIHAGWVAIIKSAKPLTTLNLQSPRWNWVGSYDHIIGYFSSAWLTLVILALVIAYPAFQSRTSQPS